MKAGESLAVAALRLGSDSVLCMVLECSAFLQHSKVLFPAHGPVFSSPVRAPHNWGLCSLWLSELRSIYARQAQCRCPACGTTWIHWPFNLDSSWDLAIAIVSVVLPHYLKVLLQASTFVCSIGKVFNKWQCINIWTDGKQQCFIVEEMQYGPLLHNQSVIRTCNRRGNLGADVFLFCFFLVCWRNVCFADDVSLFNQLWILVAWGLYADNRFVGRSWLLVVVPLK